MSEIYLNVHGINIEVKTKNDEFSHFVKENYSTFLTNSLTKTDIVVHFSQEAMEIAKKNSVSHSHVGNGIQINKDSVYWKNEFGFHIFVERQQSQMEVFSYHNELIEGQERNERYKNYQRCMRWTIHYPLFTLLQYDRGWGILHGAAATNGQQTIVFCGLNKIGKSTIATYLCCEKEYNILTDNYLLYDSDYIYAFPEVIRLGDRPTHTFGLEPIWKHKIYNKNYISPGELGTEMQATPDAFFILSQGNTLQTNVVEPKEGCETMDNLHSMLAEFPQHGYMSVWPLVTGQTRESLDERDALFETKWHWLTYEPDWNIEAIIQEVNRCI